MADKGFTLRQDFLIRGADLIIPLGERGKEQQTESEVKMTKKIANLRIHEERAINRFKHFRILQHTQCP